MASRSFPGILDANVYGVSIPGGRAPSGGRRPSPAIAGEPDDRSDIHDAAAAVRHHRASNAACLCATCGTNETGEPIGRIARTQDGPGARFDGYTASSASNALTMQIENRRNAGQTNTPSIPTGNGLISAKGKPPPQCRRNLDGIVI
jgi:hypothetical protein